MVRRAGRTFAPICQSEVFAYLGRKGLHNHKYCRTEQWATTGISTDEQGISYTTSSDMGRSGRHRCCLRTLFLADRRCFVITTIFSWFTITIIRIPKTVLLYSRAGQSCVSVTKKRLTPMRIPWRPCFGIPKRKSCGKRKRVRPIH